MHQNPREEEVNPYEELDVPEDASDEEISRAYREKAKETHPDRGGDAKDFARANEAYQMLSCSKRRRHYDKYGEDKKQDGNVSEAEKLVIAWCREELLKDPKQNIFTKVRARLCSTRDGVKNQVKRAEKGLRKLQDAQKKMERENEGTENREGLGLMLSMIGSEITQLQGKIEAMEEQIPWFGDALQLIDGLKYSSEDSFDSTVTFRGARVTWTMMGG